MHRHACCIAAIVVLSTAASCHALNQVQDGAGRAPADQSIFNELNSLIKNKGMIEENGGAGNVPAIQSKMCEICKQPLYKHTEDNFECWPVDPDTGKPKRDRKITYRAVNCPVCESTFSGAVPDPTKINNKAGEDKDFCRHSVGAECIHSNVWFCPMCGYSAPIDTFGKLVDGKPIDEDTKSFVLNTFTAATKTRMMDLTGLKAVPPPKPEYLKFNEYLMSSEIPDWVKYENALKLLERTKAPHTLMAKLYWEAAHACRREVNSEIAVRGLHNDWQVVLGKSIRKINIYLQGESLSILAERGTRVIDPTKTVTDPMLLAEAAERIMKKGEEIGNERRRAPQSQTARDNGMEEAFFSAGDMFVLNFRYAGILDRLGRFQKAQGALEEALKFLPTTLPDGVPPDRVEYAKNQIRVIRQVADDRLRCLKQEQEYLFKAAKANMAAIRFKEVTFADVHNPLAPQGEKKTMPAAPACYILGEILRRSGETAAAAAWFAAGEHIADVALDTLEELDNKTTPKTPEGAPGEPKTPEGVRIRKEKNVTEEFRSLCIVQGKVVQAILAKNQRAVDPYIESLVQEVMIACKAGPIRNKLMGAAIPAVARVSAENIDTRIETVKPADVEAQPKRAVAVGEAVATRADLFKVYFAAITRYRTEKNANPPTLQDLVTSGYIPKDDSYLNAKGKLICPETGETLMYVRSFNPGSATDTVLIPTSGGRGAMKSTLTLYANGEAREKTAGRGN